jgi:hypothetical protein
MDTNLALNVVALAFSLVAIAVSSIIALRQVKIMQHSNLLPVMIDMFREFRAPEFKKHMDYIGESLWKEAPHESFGTSNLPEPARLHVTPVASFFNTVGVLVANEVITDLTVASYMGGSTIRAWSRLAPYIRNERTRRHDENYYLFFEHLAFLVSENPPSRLNARLKLRTMPVSSPALERAAKQAQESIM